MSTDDVLAALAVRPRRIPALADQLGVNRRSMRRRVEALEREGLVEMEVRWSGAVGRPGYLVRLTETGMERAGGRS